MTLSHIKLTEMLSYCPDTGIFCWKVRPSNRVKVGDVAGYKAGNGYLEIKVCGERFLLHRLAWFYMTGSMPTSDVDHKNTVRSDNSWDNLRHVSRQVNLQNRRNPGSANTTGLLGSSRHHDGRFRAQIKLPNGKTQYLGLFETSESAHAAYVAAKRKHHEGCTI